MLTVLSSFVGAILVMGMDSAQSMYFFKNKEEGKTAQVRLVSSILQWRLLWGTFIVLLSTLLAPLLNLFFFQWKFKCVVLRYCILQCSFCSSDESKF